MRQLCRDIGSKGKQEKSGTDHGFPALHPAIPELGGPQFFGLPVAAQRIPDQPGKLTYITNQAVALI